MTNGVKFSDLKCQILHLGQGTVGYKYKLGKEWLESSPMGRDLGVPIDRRLKRSQQSVPWQPRGQTASWDAPNTAQLASQEG